MDNDAIGRLFHKRSPAFLGLPALFLGAYLLGHIPEDCLHSRHLTGSVKYWSLDYVSPNIFAGMLEPVLFVFSSGFPDRTTS